MKVGQSVWSATALHKLLVSGGDVYANYLHAGSRSPRRCGLNLPPPSPPRRSDHVFYRRSLGNAKARPSGLVVIIELFITITLFPITLPSQRSANYIFPPSLPPSFPLFPSLPDFTLTLTGTLTSIPCCFPLRGERIECGRRVSPNLRPIIKISTGASERKILQVRIRIFKDAAEHYIQSHCTLWFDLVKIFCPTGTFHSTPLPVPPLPPPPFCS